MSSSAYHFFLKHAGYSYNPATQTPMQGRILCAQRLAKAAQYAHDIGARYRWERGGVDSSEHGDTEPAYRLWDCVLFVPGDNDTQQHCAASLSAIDLGPNGTPWDDPYARVIEAELALELES